MFRQHVADGRVGFGINHEMRDFQHDRKKNLDLVICLPSSGGESGRTLVDLGEHYDVDLTPAEREELTDLPTH